MHVITRLSQPILSNIEGKKIIILQKQSYEVFEGTEVWLNLGTLGKHQRQQSFQKVFKSSRVFKRFSKAADGGQISTLTTARKLNRSCRSLGSMEGLQIQNFISEFKSFGGNKPTIKIM